MRAVLCALAILLVFPVTTVSSMGDTLGRKALAVAKRADAKATKALSLSPVTGANGQDGVNGRNGQDGRDGIDGARGAAGAAGATGAKGDTGEAGPQGPAGVASLDAASTTNAIDVPLAVFADSTVLTLPIHRDTAGSAFISYDAQLNDENGTPDGVLCELRLDTETLGERYVSVPGTSVVSVSGSALASLSVGDHVAGLSCRKSSSASLVQFPQGRARLTLLAG